MLANLVKFGVGSSLLFSVAVAVAADSQGMTKEQWLDKMHNVLPAMICKNFTDNATINKQLVAVNINYDKCVTLIPASMAKCMQQYIAAMPAQMNAAVASKWGDTLSECIGTDFALTYFAVAPSTTPASDSDGTKQPSATEVPDEMPKDTWLAKLKVVAPDILCKGFLSDESVVQRFKKIAMDYKKCVGLIPAFYDKCQKDYYSTIPATVNQENGEKWGTTIGECVGKDFAGKYLPDGA